MRGKLGNALVHEPPPGALLCGGVSLHACPAWKKVHWKEGKNMKKHLPSRVLSLLLVLALFVGLVVPMNVSADSGKQNLEFEKTDEAVFSKLSESVLDEESYENDDQYEPDDSVRVSIVLEEASTLERFGTDDIATNASAAAYRSSLKNA